MIIKAFYYLDGEPIKSVRFEADRSGKPVDKNVITANAPERWDVCSWDQGEVKPIRKKRKVEVVEEPQIPDENTDEHSE